MGQTGMQEVHRSKSWRRAPVPDTDGPGLASNRRGGARGRHAAGWTPESLRVRYSVGSRRTIPHSLAALRALTACVVGGVGCVEGKIAQASRTWLRANGRQPL